MEENYTIDNTDRAILNILMKDARKPYSEIANLVHVSPGTVHVRMRKMEEAGIVKDSKLFIDYVKLGIDITSFIGIHLEKSALFKNVKNDLEKVEEITNLYYTTGVYGLLALIRCRDTAHLREIVQDKIQPIIGIQRTETMISLEESISRPYLLR